MRLIYTYDTNNGENYCAGFTFVDGFVKCANVSVRTALRQGHTVEVYGDKAGVKFLKAKLKDSQKVVFHIRDYSDYDYDKRFWNFAKMSTYHEQVEPFLHVDFDIAFYFGFAKELRNKQDYIVTEMRRDVEPKIYNKYLPELLEIENIICSGLIGGDRLDVFRHNFNKALDFCKKDNFKVVTFDHLVAIEEYSFTDFVDSINIPVIELNKATYKHFQGGNKWSRFGEKIDGLYSLYF